MHPQAAIMTKSAKKESQSPLVGQKRRREMEMGTPLKKQRVE